MYAMCDLCRGLTIHADGCDNQIRIDDSYPEARRKFLTMFPESHTLPQEIRLCEVSHIFLRPNHPYIFTVDPNCEACVKADVYTTNNP